jgi:hypothetical protein
MMICGAAQVRAQSDGPPTSPKPTTVAKQPSKQPSFAPTALPITFLTNGVPADVPLQGLIEVRGEVYEDANGNGSHDADEPALSGVSIGAQMPGDESGMTQVAAVTVTDKQGHFALYASPRAFVTVNAAEGWRVVGAATQLATNQMTFGLRPDRVMVERVLTISPDLTVNIPPSRIAIDLTAQLATAALALGGLSVLAACIVAIAIGASTRVRSRALQAQATVRAARLRLSEHDWQPIIEQIVADAGCGAMCIERFLGLVATPNGCWMRFSDKAGRRITLAIGRAGLRASGSARGIRLKAFRHPFAIAQLHSVWRYFAQAAGQPRMLPEDVQWWLVIEPVPESLFVQLKTRWLERCHTQVDRLKGRARVSVRPQPHQRVEGGAP